MSVGFSIDYTPIMRRRRVSQHKRPLGVPPITRQLRTHSVQHKRRKRRLRADYEPYAYSTNADKTPIARRL
jgi:hypothetical protein